MATYPLHAEFSDISALAQALGERKISARELAQSALNAVDKNAALNAFVDIQPEQTLAQADAALYQAKKAGRDRAELWMATAQSITLRRS